MILRTVARLRGQRAFGGPHPATWLAWLLPVFAWAGLAYPGYFEVQSGFLPIFNLNDLLRRPGDLTWAPAVGQTYDLLRGDGALPYYLAGALRGLGMPSATAIKWVFGVSLAAGALGMYGWTRRRIGAWPGLLAAVVYAFWPIGLATVYVRGAFAEAALLGLLPWALWAGDAATAGRGWPSAALGLLLAAALWTQAGLALPFAACVLVYILAGGLSGEAPGRPRLPLAALAGWAGGLALGALGLLPRLLARGVGGPEAVDFGDHFVYPYQLLLAGWGTGRSVPGPYDGLSFDLGVVACGLALFSVLAGRIGDKGSRAPGDERAAAARLRVIQCTSAALTTVLLFLSSTLSAPLWRTVPGLSRTLTYPWQLLLLAGPFLAWLAGLGGKVLLDLSVGRASGAAEGNGRLGELPVVAGLVALALLGSYAGLSPRTSPSPVEEAPLAIFGQNEIALLSAEASGIPRPGGVVEIAARWQALRPLERDYTVFVHLVTPDGTRWAQVDTMPQGGQLPTSQWRPGQVVSDRYRLALPADAPAAGEYRYLLGLYLLETGQRLPAGADDKVVLSP